MKNHITELGKQIESNIGKASTEQPNDYDKLERQFISRCYQNIQ